MKAQLVTNSIRMGSVARDYVRLVHANQNPSTADTRPKAPAAHDVLESFGNQDRSLSMDPVVPIKGLVQVLTETLKGVPNLVGDNNGRIDGARLFRGCRVRLRGIPERTFVVKKIFWDFGEARIREIGGAAEYVVPWDCLELCKE